MRRVDPSEHAGALGAHEGPDGDVDIGGAALLAVEALLISSLEKRRQSRQYLISVQPHLRGLDLPDCQGELVILLPFPQSCLRHLWAKRCVSSASLISFWWGHQWLKAN